MTKRTGRLSDDFQPASIRRRFCVVLLLSKLNGQILFTFTHDGIRHVVLFSCSLKILGSLDTERYHKRRNKSNYKIIRTNTRLRQHLHDGGRLSLLGEKRKVKL